MLDRFDNVEVEEEMETLLEEIKDDIERAERSEDYENLTDKQKKKLKEKKELIDHILQDPDNPNGEVGEHEKTFVMFEKHPDQEYGFDAYNPQYTALQNFYLPQFNIDGKTQFITWKSVKQNSAGDVVMSIQDDENQTVKFFDSKGAVLKADPTDDKKKKKVTILAGNPGVTETITAVTGTGEEEKEVGKLNVVTYENEDKELVIISVNGTDDNFSATKLQTELNRIYAPAAVTWKVTTVKLTCDVPEEFDASPADFRGYSSDMKQLIKDFDDKIGKTSKAAHVFLLKTSKKSGQKGIMPLSKDYGFVFTDRCGGEAGIIHTIAHELGHGAFSLKHPFDEYPAITKGTTDNLMDYTQNNGTNLFKYQWDLIKDPIFVFGGGTADEASATNGLGRGVKEIHIEFEDPEFNPDPDVVYPPCKISSGWKYSVTKKAMEMFMKTPSAQVVVSWFMKKNETFYGYTASKDGPFNYAQLRFRETNVTYSGALGYAEMFYTEKGGLDRSAIYVLKDGVGYTLKQRLKYLENKVSSIDLYITFNPKQYKNSNEYENIVNIAQTIGHELFLHHYRKGVKAIVKFHNKNYEGVIEMINFDTGKKGDIDHADYINNRLKKDWFREWRLELEQVAKKEIVDKIWKQHDEKYKNLIGK